ncbi:MAG: LacI family DNA-binding transcriptional regulator [Elusimicrobiota bacterium]
MKITIDDIAKQARVSKRTVSRVLNNSPHVNKSTRKTIENIIKRNGFKVNLLAKGLSGGTGLNLIGILAGVEALYGKSYFIKIINSIENHLKVKGFNALIINISEDLSDPGNKSKIEMLHGLFNNKVICGLVVLGPVINDRRIKYLKRNGIKGIVIGSKTAVRGFGYIDSDNRQGTRDMIEHLIGCGHRKIAFINGPSDLTSSIERKAAFCETLEKNQLETRDEYIVNGDYTRGGGMSAAMQLLMLKVRPTVIVAANDDMALGAYDGARSLGISIPEDISVCGFDDVDGAALAQPPLTTVSHSYDKMGEKAASCIVENRFNLKINLPVTLVTRGSVSKLNK